MDHFLDLVKTQGFCIVKDVFPHDVIADVDRNISNYLSKSHEGIVRERISLVVRAIHGLHLFDPFFLDFAKNPFLLDFAKSYLADAIYIHQYKINMKSAIYGESWPWHQDYVYWREGDHISSPRLLNVAVALDDMTMLSGPLCVIPGSHLLGDLTRVHEGSKGDWEKDVSSDLTYKIDKSQLTQLIKEYGCEFLTCAAGDVIFFDPQLAHASTNNLSPSDRRLLLITYNAVSNAPLKVSSRPDFLCSRDYRPISYLVPSVPTR